MAIGWQSYLSYLNQTVVDEEEGVVEGKLLPTPSNTIAGAADLSVAVCSSASHARA